MDIKLTPQITPDIGERLSPQITATLQGYIGRGASGFEINGDGNLIVTMTDGQKIDLGRVKGDQGATITSIEQTSQSGEYTTYTITLSDGQTFDFEVKAAVGPEGPQGQPGRDGKDGTSVTHSWSGTRLTVTSASGTSSADLVGPAGKDGQDGAAGKDGYTPVKGKDYFDGAAGKDGVGIQSVVQTQTGTTDGGTNIITVTKTDGTKSTFTVKNGSRGSDGSDGKDGSDGVGIQSVVQTQTSNADGGSNVITVTKTDNTKSTFTVKNGSRGSDGEDGKDGSDGVGIQSVTQTVTSTEDGGSNVITVTKTDGGTSTFTVKNGSKGSTGPAGNDGQDGVSVTHKWDGTKLTISSASGTSSADLKGDTGSGFKVLDYYASLSALQSAVPNPSEGDAYGVGAAEPYDIYIYGKTSGWVNNGPLQGAKGDTGPAGQDGISVTHSWSGTTLNITSASGTSSANLVGPAGKDGAAGKDGEDGVGVQSVVQTTTSAEDGGTNVITVTKTDGTTSTFSVKNGSRGSQGQKGDTGGQGVPGNDGVGIKSVVQTTTSNSDGGENVITVTKTDNTTSTFKVKNGSRGSTGETGPKGDDGVSARHSWNGSVLSVTSASGTSSADLRGPAGQDGDTGPAGNDGVGIKSVTQTTTSSADGGENVITVTKTDNTTSTFKVKNGSKGSDGAAGKDGTSVTHSWNGTTLSVTSASGTTSADLRGPAGQDGGTGPAGKDGKDGTSVTHSWSGTTLNVTSASGTSSANLKGDKGDTGSSGSDGVGIKSVTQTTTSNADGGSNVITVTKTDNTTSTFTVKNGSKGSDGATGPAGPAGSWTQYTGTLSSTSWADSSGYKSQTITISGLKASYDVSPDFDVVLSGTDAAADAELIAAFGLISVATTGANSLTAKCVGDAPSINIPIIVRVQE
ncbi:MAG: hypothetical protein J6S23_04315 [Clostridia bacterium]|nr:hypothetical protein [Clostridia bacterium]